MDISDPLRALFGLVERLLARYSDRIITISEDERRRAVAAGLPAEKLTTILNGIAEAGDVAGATKETEGPIHLVFAGRHDRQKGLDILLRAMEDVPAGAVQLDILGEPLNDAGQPHMARPDPSPKNIRYLGWRERGEVSRIIAAADGFVMPSRWEGFGLVAIEALRAGTPVIASNRGGLPEVVTDGVTGYLVEPDAGALAACLTGLTRATLHSMGIAAKADFLARFTSRRMCREIFDVYKDVVSPGGHPQRERQSDGCA